VASGAFFLLMSPGIPKRAKQWKDLTILLADEQVEAVNLVVCWKSQFSPYRH